MDLKYLKLEIRDFIAVLTLNTPETRNSLSEDMGEEFRAVIKHCRENKTLRVFILNGEGKNFSSGGDFNLLKKNTEQSFDENKITMKKFYSYYLCICNLEIPTIASINGAAIGAGFCLALACDLRVASPGSKMGMTFVKLGLHPGMGGTFFLPKIVGIPNALELFYTGRIIGGEEAYRMGLLNILSDDQTLKDETYRFATAIASNAPIPVQQVKQTILESSKPDLSTMLDYEADSQAYCYGTSDFKEGLKCVREKNVPQFTGE